MSVFAAVYTAVEIFAMEKHGIMSKFEEELLIILPILRHYIDRLQRHYYGSDNVEPKGHKDIQI